MDKPSIAQTISQYIELKPAGKELKANCPFHEDKTPSFSVNEELGVFYCFGCGETGDVFDFLQKWSGKTFIEVCHHLGIRGGTAVRIVPDETRIAAGKIKAWIMEFSLKVAEKMRAVGENGERERRQWIILETLHDDLINPNFILELYEQRQDLENLVVNV